MTTKATNSAVWRAGFGIDVDDVHDYYAHMVLDNAPETNFLDAQYANGFLR